MSKELIRAVVEARETEHGLSAEKQQRYDAFQSVPANIELFNEVERAKLVREKAETALREAALGEYEASGLKQPFPGVGIRVGDKVVYAEDLALVWAQKHDMALKLDAREFERLMKGKAVLPAFVTLQEVITATIATDLRASLPTEALEEVGE